MKKTLARRPDFRPIEADDVKYAWAAYLKGSLASMGGQLADEGMAAPEFKEVFEREILENYHGAWTLFSQPIGSGKPVGFLLGFWSHPNPKYAPFMIVGAIMWFPWASPRSRIEAAVGFFNRVRKEIPMVEYASEEHKRFFEVIMRHGIMRRIGTSHNVYPGAPAAVFETCTPAAGRGRGAAFGDACTEPKRRPD